MASRSRRARSSGGELGELLLEGGGEGRERRGVAAEALAQAEQGVAEVALVGADPVAEVDDAPGLDGEGPEVELEGDVVA